VLSCFSQQLYEVWAAFFYGNTNIILPLGGGNHTSLITSPWTKPAGMDAPAPSSIFVSLPMQCYLSSPHATLMVRACTEGHTCFATHDLACLS
jgi:hypothetical protein